MNLATRPDDSGESIVPTGVALSAAVAGLLGVTGWYGGELSYRHRIGVLDDDSGEGETEAAATA